MKSLELLLIDEQEKQRRAYSAILNLLFQDTDVIVRAMEPLRLMEDYLPLLAKGAIAGLILDQKLEDEGFSYSGSDLATFLRGVYSKLPIFILTNYADEPEQFEGSQKDVEDIYSKRTVDNPLSPEAEIFKARMLRRLNVFVDVQSERQQRFHDLLVKSLKEPLSQEESSEMGLLRQERVIGIQAAELQQAPKLDALLEQLRQCIGDQPTENGHDR